MQITQHFTWEEATHSDYAVRHGIDNGIPADLNLNIHRQAELMEKIRYELGKPIFVTSWYRCPELNTAIGGSLTSFHMRGLACDFVSTYGSPRKICEKIIDAGIEFDQLIDEGTWVHVGLSEDPIRNQVMTARFPGGKVVYYNGLVS